MTRTIIITGASTGIGRSLAFLFAKNGYDLGLIARSGDLLLALQNEIQAAHPKRRVFFATSDVRDAEALSSSIHSLIQQLGGLDIFVANAGIGAATAGWENQAATVLKILSTNVLGAVASLEAAKEYFVKQKKGHLVGISSVAGFRGLPGSSAYCASKAALTTYLESIRLDLKHLNIPVTSVHPGYVETPMTKKNRSMPFLVSSEDAATRIFNAIQSKKSRLIFPWPIAIGVAIMRRLPDGLYDWIMGLQKKKAVFD